MKVNPICIIKTSEILNKLGITPNLDGYHYIRSAVDILVNNDITYSTCNLYSSISQHYNSKPCSVERSIRHAIRSNWSPQNADTFNSFFGTIFRIEHSPTNSEFLCTIADYLRMSGVSDAK